MTENVNWCTIVLTRVTSVFGFEVHVNERMIRGCLNVSKMDFIEVAGFATLVTELGKVQIFEYNSSQSIRERREKGT